MNAIYCVLMAIERTLFAIGQILIYASLSAFIDPCLWECHHDGRISELAENVEEE